MRAGLVAMPQALTDVPVLVLVVSGGVSANRTLRARLAATPTTLHCTSGSDDCWFRKPLRTRSVAPGPAFSAAAAARTDTTIETMAAQQVAERLGRALDGCDLHGQALGAVLVMNILYGVLFAVVVSVADLLRRGGGGGRRGPSRARFFLPRAPGMTVAPTSFLQT